MSYVSLIKIVWALNRVFSPFPDTETFHRDERFIERLSRQREAAEMCLRARNRNRFRYVGIIPDFLISREEPPTKILCLLSLEINEEFGQSVDKILAIKCVATQSNIRRVKRN